jgi:hypothetical protein
MNTNAIANKTLIEVKLIVLAHPVSFSVSVGLGVSGSGSTTTEICPPAVGLINAGEVFDKDIIAACKYYKINTVRVVK